MPTGMGFTLRPCSARFSRPRGYAGFGTNHRVTTAPVPMLEALDEAPLSRRFYVLAGAVMVGAVLDLFDFFLIAFVVTDVADEWDLTFGQTSIVLLAAGVGAIFGAIAWGRAGDRFGRRKPLMAGIVTFSLASGALALAPNDGWWFLAIFRFIVGAGVAGVAVIAVPLCLEFTPTRLRTKVVGFVTTAMVPVGIGIAAGAAALLVPAIGWRPVFAIGVLPVLLAFFVATYVPESPRWLVNKGRLEEARSVIGWLLERPEHELSLEAPPPPADAGNDYSDIWRYRASVFVTLLSWFGASVAVSGLVLWGPTFVEKVLDVSSSRAAALFVLVAIGSFGGRLFFSFFPNRVGRRLCGVLMGFGAAPLLAFAALSADAELGGVSLFLIALVLAAFFVDGGFANLTPYTPEVFPTSLRTHGMGLAWTASGLGRIIGPLVIAQIAGSSDPINPEAAVSAVRPSFLFLAAASLLVGIAFLLVRLEPHGRDLESLTEDLVEEAGLTSG
jgi:MFS transporter, putative metabolite:H+ symporter